MAQTKTIQLLRSQNLYESIQAAKTAMNGTSITEGRKDGEMLLARYNAGTTEQPKIQSLICIWHDATGIQPAGWTFIEDVSNNADSPAALKQLIKDVIAGAGLNNDGSYTAKTGDEIVQDVNSINGAVDAIINYLKGLDKTASAVDGKVVTTVSQANGLVDEAQADLTDIKMGGYAKTADTGAIAATDTLEVAISKLENRIAASSVHSNDKTIVIDKTGATTDLSVNIDGQTLVKDATDGTISSALKVIKVIPTGTAGTDEVVDANLGTNIQEAYRLVYGNSTTAIGKQINIYKDSALKEVYLGTQSDTVNPSTGEVTKQESSDPQSLNFVYHLTDNTYSITKVDVSKFLSESEFRDGLQVNGGVVSVKVDSTSERFLTVGSGGVKLSGVQAAIDAVKVTTDNTGATYVNLAVDNATGRVLTLTNTIQAVSTADSSSQGLAEASDVKTYVDNAVQSKNVSAEGDNYVSATAANNKVTVATDVQNLTFTQGSGSTNSTLSGTAQSLADGADIATKVSSFTNARISEEIAKLDSSVEATAADGNQYSVLTGVTETDGKLTAKTEVKLAAVAKTGAAADVSVTDTAGKLTATNVEAALAEIVDKADASLNSVSSTNGAIAVGTKDSDKNQALTFQVSASCAKQGDGKTNMLTIANDGLVLSDTWDCGVFD